MPSALLTTESSWISRKIKQLLLKLFLFLGWSLTWQTITKGRRNYFLPLAVNSLTPLMHMVHMSRFKKPNKKKNFFFASMGLACWWSRKLNPVHLRVRQLTQVNQTVNDFERGRESVLLLFHKRSRRNINWEVIGLSAKQNSTPKDPTYSLNSLQSVTSLCKYDW